MSITLLASFISLVLVLFLSTFRSWFLPHLFLVLLQVNNKIFFYKATCEDIIPSSYTLCANWVLKKYCHSDKYSNQVKMFCRKSCGVCNDNQVGKETVNSKNLMYLLSWNTQTSQPANIHFREMSCSTKQMESVVWDDWFG